MSSFKSRLDEFKTKFYSTEFKRAPNLEPTASARVTKITCQVRLTSPSSATRSYYGTRAEVCHENWCARAQWVVSVAKHQPPALRVEFTRVVSSSQRVEIVSATQRRLQSRHAPLMANRQPIRIRLGFRSVERESDPVAPRRSRRYF